MINKTYKKHRIVFTAFIVISFPTLAATTTYKSEEEIRIAVAEFWHETQTFSPYSTDIEDFEYYGPPTADILAAEDGFIGGFKKMIQELGGAELIGLTSPLYPAGEKTGGWVTRRAFEKYTGLIIQDLKEAGPLDGVYLSLHGGLAVTGIPKPEAEIVRRVRKVVGHIPIIVTIDLHANEDHELSDAANAVLALKRVPHYDTTLQGERAARLLIKCIRGQYKPVMATRKPGIIVASVLQATDISPGMEIMERARKWEERHRDVYVSVALGFAYADVPDAGIAVMVVTNNQKALADSIADDMAKYIWDVRKELAGRQLPPPSGGVKQAIEAVANNTTPVLIVDHSDRTGTSTHILAELIRQRAQNFCVATLRDERAVEMISSEYRAGDRIQIDVGGFRSDFAGTPIPISGTIDFIGRYKKEPIVMIRFGRNNRIILTVGALEVTNVDIFEAVGIDFNELDLIAVKSRSSFRRGFQETGITKSIVLIEAPGEAPANLSALHFKNIPEKSYPVYDGQPAAKIFEKETISDGRNFALTFAPDGKSLYVTRREVLDDGSRAVNILRSRLMDGKWSIPEKVSFNSDYRDADQFISHDGSKIFFMSERPVEGSKEKNDYDIWVAEKAGDDWGEPRHLPSEINTHPGWEGFPTVTADGALYFFSERAEGLGQSDVYRARFIDGQYAKAENLGSGINTESWDGLPYISPDETFLIFYSDRPGGYGGGDLYFSYRTDDGWHEPQNLGPLVNTADDELFPHISPDGKYLFFSRFYADGLRYIYYIKTDRLPVRATRAP